MSEWIGPCRCLICLQGRQRAPVHQAGFVQQGGFARMRPQSARRQGRMTVKNHAAGTANKGAFTKTTDLDPPLLHGRLRNEKPFHAYGFQALFCSR